MTTIGCTASSLMFSSLFKNNTSITLHEISEDFKKETGNLPNCLVYYSHSVENYRETVYKNPEVSREMREIFYKNTFIDVYCANWDGLYSPGVIINENGESENLSFLLFPKNDYLDQQWKYKMPLLYPSTASPLPRISLPNDIYINKEYADKLLFEKGYSSEQYEKLINAQITIPFSWNYKTSAERNPDMYDVEYFVKGIIDSESDEYKYYKSLFGAFFIVSEYFTLPIPSQTFFDLNDSSISEKIFRNVLKKYEYETKKSNNISGISDYVYQARIGFFENETSTYKIDCIWKKEGKFSIRVDNCFNTLLSSNVLYLIVFVSLNICMFFGLIFCSCFIKINYQKIDNKNIIIFMFWSIVFLSLGLFFGLITKNILFNFVAPMKHLSGNNPIGTIIYIAEILVSVLLLSVLRIKKRNNN